MKTRWSIGAAALSVVLLSACSGGDTPEPASLYFPPAGSSTWATVTPASLGWNTAEIPALLTLLETNGTRAFIVLKDGKIVIEEYFGENLLGTAPFERTSLWYWASAGKTLTAWTVGKAQEDGRLSIQDRTSEHLGAGWTSLAPSQENAITVRHQLTMTTGLDDGVADNHSTLPQDLVYKADPGTRWAYHNAPYTLLEQVVASATAEGFSAYFNRVLRDPTGMDGTWIWNDNDHVFYSTARSMARFGLLILAGGEWSGAVLLRDAVYFDDMITPSQDLNKSYGYLWWLNGQPSFMVPESQIVFPGSFTPNAPADMVSGMGKNGQYVCVVPSEGIVMVRMGENPSSVPVPFLFLDDIWEKLAPIIR
jgi:CubicO group peptidase (beta-lactamase class C family)